jgi:hypothetical protein
MLYTISKSVAGYETVFILNGWSGNLQQPEENELIKPEDFLHKNITCGENLTLLQ